VGGLEQTSPTNVIFLFITKAKAHLENNINMFEKLNAKEQT
jgi:hypothetical protein